MVSDSAFLLLSRVEALLLEPSRNSQPSTLDKDSVVRLDAIDATWIELFNTPVVSEIPVPQKTLLVTVLTERRIFC